MYKHGVYANLTASKVKSAAAVDTAAVYIGTAPINLLTGDKTDRINIPVKVQNITDAMQNFGYSKDWDKFTLCEAEAAHFDNRFANVGPVYFINVLDPSKHKKGEGTTASVNFVNGRAEIESSTIVIDTLVVAEKVKDVDFAVSYDFKTGKCIIDSIKKDKPLTGSLQVTYDEVDVSAVTAADIIGAVTENGEYSGIHAVSLLYQKENVVASILAAPGWSEKPEVYQALISAASDINGHFKAFVNADIPLKDGDAVDTIQKAIAWKKENGYNSEFSKVCWPEVKDIDGRAFHLSTITTVTMQNVDGENAGIPYESPSNKKIAAACQYFGAESKNKGYDQDTANALNAEGITTAVFWGACWRLWGPHTAAYKFGAELDERSVFDSTIRMLLFITNGFQLRHADKIDEPMTINVKDSIVAEEQQILDGYASIGALRGKPEVRFVENSDDISQNTGDFIWDIDAAVTTPLKSSLARVSYTTSGLKSYLGGV